MLMVHSGATDEYGVDPGKLCTYLTNNGGFTSYSELIWEKVNGAVEGFKFANFRISLEGSSADKAEKIRRYLNMGYYIVLNVGNGGHWGGRPYQDAYGNVKFMIDQDMKDFIQQELYRAIIYNFDIDFVSK